MKKARTSWRLCLTCCICTLLIGAAGATDYTMDAVQGAEFRMPTDYADVYGSEYNYGGKNAAEYAIPPLQYGNYSHTQIGPMEKTRFPGSLEYVPSTGSNESVTGDPDVWYPPLAAPVKFTDADTLRRTDGSIGTLKIPSLGIGVKVYDGTTDDSMQKGVGHFTTTTAWDGNVGVCGHNRGANIVIGSIKDLDWGDTITYTTSLGTRDYRVVFVGKISSSDWSFLGSTSDNRITMITCVANQPSLRWCVQAIER